MGIIRGEGSRRGGYSLLWGTKQKTLGQNPSCIVR
jgi:hypothetical protein